jgi:hypothetical protein
MSEHTKTLRFVRRAAPVFPEHRPLYKIAQILLMLELASRGGKSSLPRLQLLNWALKTAPRRARLVEAVKKGQLNLAAWGFDPVVAIALRFAEAEKLIKQTATGYQITNLGKSFTQSVCKDTENLESERSFLTSLGKSLTEGMVSAVSDKWGEV